MKHPKPIEVLLSVDEWYTLTKLTMGYSHVLGRMFRRTCMYIGQRNSTHFFTTNGENPWRLKYEAFGNPCCEIPAYCWLIAGEEESLRRDLMMLKVAL